MISYIKAQVFSLYLLHLYLCFCPLASYTSQLFSELPRPCPLFQLTFCLGITFVPCRLSLVKQTGCKSFKFQTVFHKKKHLSLQENMDDNTEKDKIHVKYIATKNLKFGQYRSRNRSDDRRSEAFNSTTFHPSVE